jgi:hypothetical protein
MLKKILPLILLFLMSALATAYSVVDYDQITYAGDKSTLLLYGWRNSTTSDGLSYCNAYTSYVLCSNPSFSHGVHHLFNQVNDTYCLTKNNSFRGGVSNFSIRVNFELLSYTGVSAQRIGFSEYYTSTPTDNMYLIIYGNTTNKTKFCLHSISTESCAYISPPIDTSAHTMQIDFIMYEQAGVGTKNISIQNATLYIDGINQTSLSNADSTPTTFDCINSTIFYFKGGLIINDIYVIHYNQSEGFVPINTSLLPNVTYQCNDGIDNDADSFIDMDDPQCDFLTEDSELPADTAECTDGEDNDDDFLVDYPQDTACDNASDNNEFPRNYFQCNDGVDNDGDGLADYGYDPSCISFSDNDESPKDSTTEVDDICLAINLCLLKTTFPYTDSIYLHSWSDLSDLNQTNNVAFQGGYSVLLSNNFSIRKSFINPATLYNTINAEIGFTFLEDSSCTTLCQDNNSFFVLIEDEDGNTAIKLKFIVNTATDTVLIYNINSTGNEQLISINTYPFTVNIDNFRTFSLIAYINNDDSSLSYFVMNNNQFPFFNSSITIFDSVRIVSNDYLRNKLLAYINSIYLYASTAISTTCTMYAPPYYLKEEFIYGKPYDCGWKISPQDTQVNGMIEITNDVDYFSLYNGFYDTVQNTYVTLTNRYSAFEFKFYLDSNSTSNNIFVSSLWDKFNSQILSLQFTVDGKIYSQSASGSMILLTQTTLDTWHTIKILTDIASDKSTIYLDGNAVYANLEFYDNEFDATNIALIFFQSAYSQYKLDNIYVYVSDENGTSLPQSITAPKIVQNETSLFGIMYKQSASCTIDSDCQSGMCMKYSKKCSVYNYKLCDEKGYNRTMWCFVKLLFGKGLEWFVDMILDNLLLFIGFLIIIMLILFFYSKFKT